MRHQLQKDNNEIFRAGGAQEMTSSSKRIENTLLIGKSGSGKTQWASELIDQCSSCGYRVFIIDAGASYKDQARLLGGSYYNVALYEKAQPGFLQKFKGRTCTVFDLEDFRDALPKNKAANSILEALSLHVLSSEAPCLVILDEIWQYAGGDLRLVELYEAISSNGGIVITLLQAMSELDLCEKTAEVIRENTPITLDFPVTAEQGGLAE